MSWKRMIFGEKTPDKNDPKYKERYEKEVEAGRKTARFLKIDRLSAKIQTFASKWPKTFLSIVVTLMIFCFCYNGYILLRVFSRPNRTVTATELQRQRLDMRKAEKLETLRPEKIIPRNSKSTDAHPVNADIKVSSEDNADEEVTQELSQVEDSQSTLSQANTVEQEVENSNTGLSIESTELNSTESEAQHLEQPKDNRSNPNQSHFP